MVARSASASRRKVLRPVAPSPGGATAATPQQQHMNSRQRQQGGLVSRRVEMYETPLSGEKKGYFHRQQDSFHHTDDDDNHHRLQQSSAATHEIDDSRDEVVGTPMTSKRDEPEKDEKVDPNVPTSVIALKTNRLSPALIKKKAISSTPTPSATAAVSSAGGALMESGVKHYAAGEYEKAVKAFTAALKSQRASIGKDDIGVALTLSNLGAVYLQQNCLDDAERVLYESLELKKELAPDMALTDTLNNLGNCANIRGDYATSLVFYEEALDDIRVKEGRKVDEINALFNIGRLNIQQERWSHAMTALNEACQLARQQYGTNHIFVAQTLDLMGYAQLSTAKLEPAMVSFTGSLAIYRRLYGPMHLEVANSLYNVGMVRQANGDLSDAWEAYTTARDLYYRLGTENDHPGFTTVRRSIAKIEKDIAAKNKHRSETASTVTRSKKQTANASRYPGKRHVV